MSCKPMHVLPGAITLLFAMGCVTVHAPRATVELSEIVAERTAEMEASHEAFVRLYYAEVRAKIDRFLTEKWIPTFLARATQNEQFRHDHELAVETARLDPEAMEISLPVQLSREAQVFLDSALQAAIETARTQLGSVLIGFGEEALRQISLQRDTLIGPIDTQEQMVLSQLRESYADLQQSQAAIKGYLASVVELKEENDIVMQELGILKTQRQVLDFARGTSDAALNVLTTTQDIDAGTRSFLGVIKSANAKIEGMIEGGAFSQSGVSDTSGLNTTEQTRGSN